jgi:hypothetical protein
MAPVQSKISTVSKEVLLRIQMQANPPAISFDAKTKRAKVKVGEDGDNSDQRIFNVPLDNKNTAPDKTETYKAYIACFEEGTPEDWCSLRTEAKDLFNAMGITGEADKQHNVWRCLLKGQAKDRFTALYNHHKVDNDAKPKANKLSEEQLLRVVLNGVAKHVFPNWQQSERNQKQYMRHALNMGSMEPGVFCERLQKMNRYFEFFPTNQPLVAPPTFTEDELLQIVGLSISVEWSITMMTTNQTIDTFNSMENAITYFKQLHQADKLRKQIGALTKFAESNNKKRNADPPKGTEAKKVKVKAKCPHCGKMGTHPPEECTANPANKNKAESNYNNKNNFKKPKPAPKPAAATINAMEATHEEPIDLGSDADFEENLDQFLAQIRGD